MLRREDEGERSAYAEPTGDQARSRGRRRRLQNVVYWGGLFAVTGLLALFLAFTLPDRGKAEKAQKEEIATISAEKTVIASATAAAATAAAGGTADSGQ